MNTHAIYLLLSLFLAHWAADYTHLSTAWMLNAKRFGKPILPILSHAGMHGWLTFLVVGLFTVSWSKAIIAANIMLSTHCLIDILKGRLNVWYPSLQTPTNVYHWYVFGADQTLHIYVIVLIAYLSIN